MTPWNWDWTKQEGDVVWNGQRYTKRNGWWEPATGHPAAAKTPWTCRCGQQNKPGGKACSQCRAIRTYAEAVQSSEMGVCEWTWPTTSPAQEPKLTPTVKSFGLTTKSSNIGLLLGTNVA